MRACVKGGMKKGNELPSTSTPVSVAVSFRMRKMLVEVRKMFSNARDAEQDGREKQASRNF
jgi:hypothetical protein